MKRKSYQHPAVHLVTLHNRHHILDTSSESQGRPSATFMSNPNVYDEGE